MVPWRRDGVDLQTIQEWPGHATLNQTARYAKYRKDNEEDARVVERTFTRLAGMLDVLPFRAAV